MLLKLSPILLILLYTIFIIPWKKHPVLLLYRVETLKLELEEYTKNHIKINRNGKKSVRFLLSKERVYPSYSDTLVVQFTKNEFTIISDADYDAPKFSWNVGYVEHCVDGKCKHLFNTYNSLKNFIVPLTLIRGRIPEKEKSIFLSLLPKEMRYGATGEEAKVLY